MLECRAQQFAIEVDLVRSLVEQPHDFLELHVAAAQHRCHHEARGRRAQGAGEPMLSDANELRIRPFVRGKPGFSIVRAVALDQVARVARADEALEQFLQVGDRRSGIRLRDRDPRRLGRLAEKAGGMQPFVQRCLASERNGDVGERVEAEAP